MATLPTGVEIRGKSICIWFIYREKRCREVLKGWAITPANLKKAGNFRASVVSDIQFGTFDYANRFPESKRAKSFDTTIRVHTFGELCDTWFNTKQIEFSPNTRRQKGSIIKSLKLIINSDTPITSITHNDILNWRNEILTGATFIQGNGTKSKQGRTVQTVDQYVNTLCTLLRFAHRSKYIEDKPFEFVKKLQKGNKKPDPLSREEYEALMQHAFKPRRILWTVAMFTGLRHGELCALAWEDIDLVKGTLKVKRNLTISEGFGPPKTKAGYRTIHLLKPALKALQEQKLITFLRPKTEIVLHHREHGKTETENLRFIFVPRIYRGEQKSHYSHSTFKTLWVNDLGRSRIRYRRPYQTRHTYACWALSAGANPAFIA